MMAAFNKDPNTIGWPEPMCDDLKRLSDVDLADYIDACGYEYDGMGQSVREALVRLLRRPCQLKARERK